MFDLEQSIANWRKQMLAAGINTPVPLEELEIHLRDEIERQMKSGTGEQAAFETASAHIGKAEPIKAEFKRAGGFWEVWGENKATRTNRALGLLWFVYCAGSFYNATSGVMSVLQFQNFQFTPLFFLAAVLDFIYLRGLIASVLLFGGVMRERRFILFLAALDAVGGVAFLLSKSFQPLSFAFTILGFVTIWLLWPTPRLQPATE